MLAFAIFAVTFVVALIAAVVYFNPSGSSKRRSTVPGMDPTDPNEGNFPDIGAAGSLHEFLMKLHKTYGSIASFWFGKTYTVSIASPELFKEHIGLFDRPPELFALFEPLIGQKSIQYANKADGRKRRNMYDPSFAHTSIGNHYGTFNELAGELVQKLLTIPKDEHVSLMQHCHALVITALTRTSFGDFFKSEELINKFRQAYNNCWYDMERSLSQGLPVKGSDREKMFNEALGFLHDTVRNTVKECRANPSVGHQSFIDVLLENELPEDQILSDCVSYMVGGFHTSGNLFLWILYFLASNQDCQEKLHQEIKVVLGDGEVDKSNVKDMKYLRQVINEGLRVSVLAPYAARFQDSDSKLGGHVIPGGTPVMHALGVVLQDEELWPEPEKFDPERFSVANFTPRHKMGFQSFGFAGKRVCPGKYLSYAEISVFVAVLCRDLKFNLAEGQVVEKFHGLVTSPKSEIWFTLEKRG
ncbi:cytochrome P450 20A1-like [Asterias amurensis]|uniref:cytochrome P450 20A1-like n=1 Tax=Asterias amurensis TaxID=7602 RepID=UPI003AB411CD